MHCMFVQAANLVRVLFEVTKQRMQANTRLKPIAVVKSALQSEVSPTLGAVIVIKQRNTVLTISATRGLWNVYKYAS